MKRTSGNFVELQKYEALGMAAMLPGMVHAVELMQEQIETMRTKLAAFQGEALVPAPARRVLRKATKATKTTTVHGTPIKPGFWAKLTPAERSAEMRRRYARRTAKAIHPRDPRHPEHEKWLAHVSKAARKHWGGMSVKRLAKMQAGKVNGAATEARETQTA